MKEESFDVIVAGGGTAGLAAAIAAARSGARTLLVERHGALGGMATAALVHSICGLYHLRDEPEAEMAHSGFAAEFAHALLAAGAAEGPHRFGRVDLLLTSPPLLPGVADALCAAEPLLEVALHTEVTSATVESGTLKGVTLHSRGSRRTATAHGFVDATGDAALATLAGAATEQAPTLQRPAFIFTMGGADAACLDGNGRLRVAQRLVAGVREGRLSCALLGVHLRPGGCRRPGEVYITIDLGEPPGGDASFDPLSPRSMSTFAAWGRALALELTTFLRKESPPFAGSFLASLPTQVGIRESRRIVGRARLEAADIVNGATFSDAVALSTWPIELRETATGPRLRYPTGNRACEIPLGALMARDLTNLFVAGRCLSSSHEAHAALRVIGTCLATGEAAGLAAALYKESSPLFEDLPSAAATVRARRSARPCSRKP